VLAQVVGPEQAFFLRRHRREQHRMRRLRPRRDEGVREFYKNAAPRTIVDGAVVDLVAAQRRIKPKMIVMAEYTTACALGPPADPGSRPSTL